MPTFSVIIPTYNRASSVVSAVASVFDQSYADFEVVVVDDGSTDDTRAALAPFSERITYLEQRNAGPGAARNLGLDRASGEYVVFLDSDDLFFPWTLATLAEVIAKYDTPALVLSDNLRFRAEGDIAAQRCRPLHAAGWQDYLSAAHEGYRVTAAAAISRPVLQEYGGFSTRNTTSEDHDLFLRLGEAAGFVFVESPYLYAYRTNALSLSADTGALYAGLRLLLRGERRGRYGGSERSAERAALLKRIIRYKLRRCLANGDFVRGCLVYLRSLPYLLSVDHAAVKELAYLIWVDLESRNVTPRLEKSTQF